MAASKKFVSKKLVDLDTALSVVKDGMTLGIGGWIFHGQPMALVRGLIRKGVRDLTLVPSPGSVAPDMLIGAGCVKTTACVFISF
ncbi:MAG: CoA-transferase, partial [Pseudomonadota bacterium]